MCTASETCEAARRCIKMAAKIARAIQRVGIMVKMGVDDNRRLGHGPERRSLEWQG